MNLLKKRSVAIVILILAIVLSSLYGFSKRPVVSIPEGGVPLDETLDTAYFQTYIVDQADVLSPKTEKQLSLYNANWDQMTQSIMAVVTVESLSGTAEDAAWDWGEQLQLGEDDALVLFCKQTKEYSVVAAGDFYDLLAKQSVSFVDTCLYGHVQNGDYDKATLSLFGQLHLCMSEEARFLGGPLGVGFSLGVVLMVLLMVVVLVLLLRSRRNRYGSSRSYRSNVGYGGGYTSTRSYRRTSSSIGANIGSFVSRTSNYRSSSSGGTSSRPSSGSFGGRGRSGGSSFGSSRSGSFGGSRSRSSGGSRSGGFGGSRGRR